MNRLDALVISLSTGEVFHTFVFISSPYTKENRGILCLPKRAQITRGRGQLIDVIPSLSVNENKKQH